MPFELIVRIGNGVCSGTVPGNPLILAGRALAKLPLKAVQVFEKVVVPLYWIGSPRALQAASERVGTLTAAIGVSPAQPLLFERGGLRIASNVALRYSTVRFAEGMPADD